MQIRNEQLATHLQKNLAPFYLISGDVPLLVQEAANIIRQAVRQKGFTERRIFHVETGFSWPEFLAESNAFSLFASKQLLELRLNSNQLGEGTKALQSYAANPPPDKILLITIAKLDAKQQKAVWYQALLKTGVVVQLWPIPTEQLPQWIGNRLTAAGFQADREGIALLAARAEGNLLAATQEIEKLRLLYDKGPLTATAIAQAVADSARFDVFQLADAVLQGEAKRVIRILLNLRTEGTEPILILWALSRELRILAAIAYQLQNGTSLERALQNQQVWEKRKSWVSRALKRLSLAQLRYLLQQASQIDGMIKGAIKGNVWNELEKLALGWGQWGQA